MADPVVYNSLEQLLARIEQHMTANGNNENTGARTQQLLKELVLGVLAIIGDGELPVPAIPNWDDQLEYNDMTIVRHDGLLWLFVAGQPNVGTEPGSNDAVWGLLNSDATAHVQGTDQVLDEGGSSEVTAQELREHLDHKPDLETVLDEGNVTGPHDIIISPGQALGFRASQSDGVSRIIAPVVGDNNTLNVPNKSGTIATTDDVAAVAALVDGALRVPEAFVPAGNYPATYGGDPVSKGDTFRLAAGTMGGVTVDAEDLLVALVDTPGQNDANWQVLESNRVVATQQEAEDQNSQDTAKLMPPKRWWQAWSKGLGLTAFLNAVRGTKLDGYTVGPNAALATGDTILGALGKAQGQLNGKLAKASNLSDLPNVDTALSNLGLGWMPRKNVSTAIIHEILSERDLGVQAGALVEYDVDNDRWVLATRRVDGIVLNHHISSSIPSNAGEVILRKGYVYIDNLPASEPNGDRIPYYYLDGNVPGRLTKEANGAPVLVTYDGSAGGVYFDPVGFATYVGGGSSAAWDVGFIQAGGKENVTGGEQRIFTGLLDEVVLRPGAYQFDLQFRMELTDVGSSGVNGAPTLSLFLRKSGGGSTPVHGHLAVTQQNEGVPGTSGIMVHRTPYKFAEVPNKEFVNVSANGMLYFFDACEVDLLIGTTDADHNVRVEEFSSFTWRKLKDPV